MASFKEAIEEAFTEVDSNTKKPVIAIPEIQGKYSENLFTGKSFELTIDNSYKLKSKENGGKSDLDVFRKLYKLKPGGNANYGNSEVALFWLFGGHLSSPNVIQNNDKKQKNAEDVKIKDAKDKPLNDLIIFGNPVEVKAYPRGNTKLGSFSSFKDFLDLLNIIFSVSNIVTPGKSTVSVLNFNYNQLDNAAGLFCKLRYALMTIQKNKAQASAIKEIGVITNLYELFENFDKTATKVGLSDLCYKGKEETGGKEIASGVLAYGLKELLLRKPGPVNGYIALPPPDFNSQNTIEFKCVVKNSEVNVDKSKLQDIIANNVSVKSGNFFVNFEKIFS